MPYLVARTLPQDGLAEVLKHCQEEAAVALASASLQLLWHATYSTQDGVLPQKPLVHLNYLHLHWNWPLEL